MSNFPLVNDDAALLFFFLSFLFIYDLRFPCTAAIPELLLSFAGLGFLSSAVIAILIPKLVFSISWWKGRFLCARFSEEEEALYVNCNIR